jgi:hypothetical protein
MVIYREDFLVAVSLALEIYSTVTPARAARMPHAYYQRPIIAIVSSPSYSTLVGILALLIMTDASDLFALCAVHSRGTQIDRFLVVIDKKEKRGSRLAPGLTHIVWILFDYTIMFICVTHEGCAQTPK